MLFPFCEVPQATVPSAGTHRLQCVAIHRLQSAYLLTMVSPGDAGESLLPNLEHLLLSFFPPFGAPSALSFCSLLLPQWCFLSFLQYIFPKAPPDLVARLSSALHWVGWSWKLSVQVTAERNVTHGETTLERGKSMKRGSIGDDLLWTVHNPLFVPPPSALLGVEGSDRVINETVKLSQGKGVLRGEWFRLFFPTIQLYFN